MQLKYTMTCAKPKATDNTNYIRVKANNHI